MSKYKYDTRWIKIPLADGTTKPIYLRGKDEKDLDRKEKERIKKAEKEIQNLKYPLFSDYIENWYYSIENEVAHYTWSCYKKPYMDLKEEFGEKRINEISSYELQEYLDKMKKQGYAKQTISLRKIVANRVFKKAMLDKNIRLEYNPAAPLTVPKNAPKKHYPLPPQSDIDIVKNSLTEPLGLFYYFTLYTGCRREEALAIDWQNIDFENNKIKIDKVLIFINGKGVIEDRTKSEAGVRFVPLLNPLKEVLQPIRKDKGLLFNINGNPYYESLFIRETNQYKKDTNISTTPHSFRIAYATILYEAGLKDKDAQHIMGHSKIEITKNIYTRIRNEREQEFLYTLNDFVEKH